MNNALISTKNRKDCRLPGTMGIPRLTTQISPYGESIIWKKQVQRLVEHQGDVIIDGPSFAYYIHKLCLTTKSNARNALEALPTYPELGEAAVTWLNQIESFGLHMYVAHSLLTISQAKTSPVNTYTSMATYHLQKPALDMIDCTRICSNCVHFALITLTSHGAAAQRHCARRLVQLK